MLVVDLSGSVAGAFCARLLALRGERVVAAAPLAVGDEWVDRYLRADIESFTGTDAELSELIRRADVLLTGSGADPTPGSPNPRALNPEAVEVAVSCFGSEGPYADFASGPRVAWAAGGYLAITGLPEREPLPGPEHLPAYASGYAAAAAVEVGLLLRRRGHVAPRLDISTMEVMATAHQTTFSMFGAAGAIQRRHRHPQPHHPLDLLECADGWVSLAVVTPEQFDAFATAIGDPELLLDERFADGRSRHANADAFDARVQAWFRARGADETAALLQQHQVPAVALTDPLSVLDDPQLAARGYWQSLAVGSRTGRMPGDPIRVHPAAPAPATAAARSRREPSDPPLAGTLVVDLTDFWAGPLATRTLADLGARVVRIERPGARSFPHPAAAFVDWSLHRGKLSLAANLKTEDGRRVARALARKADVLVENYRPGVVEKFGLAHEQVAADNPGLVYVSLSGFGQDGPRAEWASFGPMLEAASSLQARTHYEDGIPLQLGHSLPDPVGGFAGAFAALHCLRAREATGRGAHVDLSQLEAYAALCGEDILRASVEGRWRRAPRRGRLLRCRGDDAWVAVDAEPGACLAALAGALGCDASAESVESALAERDKFEVAEIARGLGLPAFPVLDAADLAGDPHLLARGYLLDLELGGIAARMPTTPIRAGAGGPDIARRAPRAGQDSERILREILGEPSERIAELFASGAIAAASEAG